jgi:hypothetical protein
MRAQDEGELGADKDPQALARFQVTFMHGLVLLAILRPLCARQRHQAGNGAGQLASLRPPTLSLQLPVHAVGQSGDR